MSAELSLEDWKELATRDTRGDMVWDILNDWEEDRKEVWNSAIDAAAMCITEDENPTVAHDKIMQLKRL